MNNLNHYPTLAPRFFGAAILLALAGIAGSALAAVRYVDLNSANPTVPYTSWGMAATNIQDAVDAAVAGDEIVVTNGIYATGGRVIYGSRTNRVAVTKPLVLRSVNGPAMTVIQGNQVPGTTNGSSAVRCLWLTNGAVLSGFKLTKGATRTAGDLYGERSGGGLWCSSPSIAVSNCIFAANGASLYGGGTFSGALYGCALSTNFATTNGGGAWCSTLSNCVLTANAAAVGGAAYSSTLNNCTLNANVASSLGGGTWSGTLSNCVLTANSATAYNSYGGGACESRLENCLLTANSGQIQPIRSVHPTLLPVIDAALEIGRSLALLSGASSSFS